MIVRVIRALVVVALLCSTAASQLVVTPIPSPGPIPRYMPFEVKLQHSTVYANPFWDVSITSTFTSPGGVSYAVEGFYYDTSYWMVRFSPLIEGTWSYSILMTAAGGNFQTSGTFTCVASSLNGPLRVDPDNPERLVRDDGAPFNAIGTNFYTYEHPSINGAWTPIGLHCSVSTLVARWAEYFETYRLSGGNAWRRIVGNEHGAELSNDGCISGALFEGEIGVWHDDGPDQYDLERSLALDTEFSTAREKNMAVILTLLNKQLVWYRNPCGTCLGGPIPCNGFPAYPTDFFSINNATSKQLHEKYFRYMVARYSAFVDIWELFNEFDDIDDGDQYMLDFAWKSYMAAYIRGKHPYHDLVATTTAKEATVEDSWQDLVIAHRYSDAVFDHPEANVCTYGCAYNPTVLAQNVDTLISSVTSHVGKPDLIDEFGIYSNSANDDPDHHRIGIWTALHRDTGTLFWDAGSRTDCNTPCPPGGFIASAYISDTTRTLFAIRQAYAAKLPGFVKVAATQPTVAPSSAFRAFAVEDQSTGVYSAYIHTYDNHASTVSGGVVTIAGLVNESHEGVWFDPKTGAELLPFTFSGTQLVATIPTFTPTITQDIALLIRPNVLVDILTTSLPVPAHGAPYYYKLRAKGGGMPYTWAITRGGLPVGMALDADSGLISGTPQYGGQYQFTVQVTAQPLATGGGTSTDQVALSIQWTDTFTSIALHDGIVIESAQGSGVGGSKYHADASAFGLGVGDDAQNKKVVTIVSFNTASIPDTAVIDSAQVTLTSDSALRGNANALDPLHLDIKTGFFGAVAQLELADFEACATCSPPCMPPCPPTPCPCPVASREINLLIQNPPAPLPVQLVLDQNGRAAVNKTGLTQCRVYLNVATDGDGVQDAIGFSPGEYANTALRPTLVVRYH